MHLGILTSHPIQYQAPWFRGLAKKVELEVFFCHRQSAAEQGKAGFGVAFEWDVDLLSGYRHRFLKNVSSKPGVNHFFGCDTPEIAEIVQGAGPQDYGLRTTDQGTTGGQKSVVSGQRSVVSGQWSVVSGQWSVVSGPSFDAFIVTGWHLKSYWQAVRACRRAGVPVLVRGDSQLLTPRSLLKRWAKELVHRVLVRQFDGFLVVGMRNREYLRHYGVPDDKMFFVPHFVDNEWFAERAAEARGLLSVVSGPSSPTCPPFPDAPTYPPTLDSRLPSPIPQPSTLNPQPSSRSALRSQWGANDSDLVALFVGKFIPKKRPLDLVAAVQIFTAENAKNAQHTIKRPVHLLFVGSGELGAQLRASTSVVFDAESPISQPSTINHQLPPASFTGFKNQSELPRCYAAADVLVLPSESETWGLVVNEAMACSLPAIVSDAVGCAPDLIDEGKTGFTFPLGDVVALAERLATFAKMKLAGHDFTPALTAKMQTYSLEAAVRGTVAAVEKLKAEKRKS